LLVRQYKLRGDSIYIYMATQESPGPGR
jgi:hypothetical protein